MDFFLFFLNYLFELLNIILDTDNLTVCVIQFCCEILDFYIFLLDKNIFSGQILSNLFACGLIRIVTSFHVFIVSSQLLNLNFLFFLQFLNFHLVLFLLLGQSFFVNILEFFSSLFSIFVDILSLIEVVIEIDF
jgi:hypothetical protein